MLFVGPNIISDIVEESLNTIAMDSRYLGTFTPVILDTTWYKPRCTGKANW